ncbi:MAG: hypothetical protein NTU88_11380 [Armatimonadetes bacterium]|nr:hypothetical protein [Armatimonadota bacterium]
MLAVFRGMVLAALVLLALMTLATTAHAESWSSALTTGLTSIESVFQDGTYTWTLTNNSSMAGDASPAYDILVWRLTPFQVRRPLDVIAPDGWKWSGDDLRLISNGEKYYTPYALGPAQSVVFSYTPDPSGPIINNHGPQPMGLGFIAHVAAVVPGSGPADGTDGWTSTRTPTGFTWYDRSSVAGNQIAAVPELKGLLVLALAICTTGFGVVRGASGRR